MTTSESEARYRGAFTLVELVIAITVVALLAGMAVPAVESIQRERLAREPINQLALLAREMRGRAMDEQRPYQIVIDGEGFHASRFLRPYSAAEEADEIRQEIEEMATQEEMLEASHARSIQLQPDETENPRRERVREGMRFFQEYKFPQGVQVSARFWDDLDWVSLTGQERRRWIFQPSGMCEPMKIRVEAEQSFFEVDFHPLTAEVKSEKSWVE